MKPVKGVDRVWFEFLPETDEVYIYQTETIKANTCKVWENKMSVQRWMEINAEMDSAIFLEVKEPVTIDGEFAAVLDKPLDSHELILGLGNINKLRKAELQEAIYSVTGERPDDSVTADMLRERLADMIKVAKEA